LRDSIGRQAPVKRCLARFAELAFRGVALSRTCRLKLFDGSSDQDEEETEEGFLAALEMTVNALR